MLATKKQRLAYSSCMDIGWSDEIKLLSNLLSPPIFSEVASIVKRRSAVSLLDVTCTFKETSTI